MSLAFQRIAIGFRTPTLRGLDPAAKMALARELDLALVEPQCAPHELADAALASAYGAAARAAGVAVRSLGHALPFHDEAADLAAACAGAIAACRAVGCGYVFAVVAKPADREEPQAASWRRAAARVGEALSRLEDAGIRLAIEPDHGAFVQDAERLEQLLDAVGDDRLLVNFDACNLYLGGSDPLRALCLFAGRIRSGHIKDGRYRCGEHRECAIGTGELDWDAILAAMAAADLECSMHIEHCTSVEALRSAHAHVAAVVGRLAAG